MTSLSFVHSRDIEIQQRVKKMEPENANIKQSISQCITQR